MRSIEQLVAEGKAKPRRRRRDRFAPDLSEFVERATVGGPGPRPTGIAAREQLRRLLSVARAAWKQAQSHGFDRPCSCDVCRAVERNLVTRVPREF